MKTYYVYDTQSDDLICKVEASSVVEAEIMTCIKYNKSSESVYAFSEEL